MKNIHKNTVSRKLTLAKTFLSFIKKLTFSSQSQEFKINLPLIFSDLLRLKRCLNNHLIIFLMQPTQLRMNKNFFIIIISIHSRPLLKLINSARPLFHKDIYSNPAINYFRLSTFSPFARFWMGSWFIMSGGTFRRKTIFLVVSWSVEFLLVFINRKLNCRERDFIRFCRLVMEQCRP